MRLEHVSAWERTASPEARARVHAEGLRAWCFWQFEARDLSRAAQTVALEVAVIAEQFAEQRRKCNPAPPR